MKTATPALIALLNAAGGGNPFIETDFYTFTLQDGTMLRFGTANYILTAASSAIWNPPDITTGDGMWFDGITWPPERMSAGESHGTIGHWATGLGADSWNLTYNPRHFDEITGEQYPDKINGVPWVQAAQAGMLDNADVIISTAYFSAMPEGPISLNGVSPVGTLIIARGMVGAVDVGDSAVHISVTDYRALLNQQMPRNLYQGGCRHRLYDTRCGLDAATYTKTGVLSSASEGTSLVATAPVDGPGGSDTFNLGVLTITSGENNGFQRLVSSWNGATRFSLLNPFPFPIPAGTTFSVRAGCNKRLATCRLFNNEDNYGGNPYIPLPEIALG